MLDYEIIGLIVGVNLILYLIITLPLDYITYKTDKNSRVNGDTPETRAGIFVFFAFLTTIVVWILLIGIPIDLLINSNIFQNLVVLNIPPYTDIIQILGMSLITLATLVAIGGRLSRGKRAFSWGIPKVLETKGMYRYVRHPLYSSYCFYFIGFLFIFQNGLFIFLLLGIPGYYYISIYEEEILVQHFGQEYLHYQKKTKRLIPFIW